MCKCNKYMLSEILLHGQILYRPPKGHLVSAVSPESAHGCADGAFGSIYSLRDFYVLSA